ncbi:MAG: T9SS type A sorting domain-containing protein [Saprospiraceae bacterium]|nr:T9SS type A sorting domain-containing protein [Saprospiraceae bacterium]
MRSQHILLLIFCLTLTGMKSSFAQSNNFHVQVEYYGHWIDGDRIGDGTSLPDPTFRLWTNLHTGSQSGQSNGSFGTNYYWLHLPNTNCYDCYYNSPITLINTNVNVPAANLNLSDGFFFNLRLECHENDDGNNETVGGSDDWVQTADHNRRIQINPDLNYPVVQEYEFATNGDPSVYRVRIRIRVNRLDAFAPTLRYANTAGVSQNLFCSGDPMRIYADYNQNFSGGVFEWQGSNDNGANWYWIASTAQNFINWNANNPMSLIRCRLTRPCPTSVYGSSALNCVGTSYFFGIPFPDINVNAGSGGTSDGWISTQGVPITVGPPPPDLNAINTTITNTCQGSNNGAIQVNIGSINPGFVYSLTLERSNGQVVSPGGNYTAPNGATSINHQFTGLQPDTYTVKVTIRVGTIDCTTAKGGLTVIANPLPVVSAIGTAGACFGQNGSVTIFINQHSIANTIQGFQLYDNSEFNLLQQFYTTNTSSFTFNGVSPGTYKARAINGNNCTSAFFTVVVPNPPSAVTAGIGTDNFGGTGNQIQCNGSNGEIRVTPSGGTPNYNIAVSGGGGQNGVGSGVTATFLRTAGTYSITVTDANNCTYNPPNVTLNQPPALSVNVNTTPTGVCVSNGTATFNGQGGVGPYTYRLNFDGGFNSNNNFSNLGAGDYTAFVRDVTGCERSVVFTISQLPALQVSASNVTPVVCFGENTGSVTLSGTGGKAPYTYAIENGSFGSNNVFGSLTAATYIFRIRDADFCEAQAQITVSTPDALLVASHVYEPGDCGSTIRPTVLTITGRAPGTPLEISTDNGGIWSALTEIAPENGNIRTRLNLSVGNYTIRVREVAGGCLSNDYPLNVPLGVLLGISQTGLTHETCAGDNDGSITVGLLGDVQPYTVRLFRINGTTPTEIANSGPINTASHTFSNLQPGNYAVWVSNPAGCGEGLPAGFMGTGPYSGPTLTINARPALAASPASTGPLINCYGNNGVITVNNTTGGQAPYEYRLNGGTYQSSNVLTGALASNNVYVRDANQCVLGPLPVNIGLSPANFTLDATAVLIAPRTANCSDPGDPDFGRGAVSVSISGGTAPYEVKIIPANQNCQDHYNTVTPTNNTTLNFTALEAGDYIVCIRDAGGCIANRNINVPLLPALNISVTGVTNTACLEDDLNGSITFTASGGTPPYTVTLNNADPQTGNASSTFSYTGLAPGIYLLTLTDQRGCTYSTTRQVAALSGLSATVSQTNISPCSYSDNGVIQITPFGGIAPYTVTWLWDNTAANNVANNQMVQRTGLPIGSYSVRIADASGCIIQRDFGLTGPVQISAVLIPQNALCSTVADGTLTVNALGGTGALSYSIGGAFQSNNVFTGLANGSYTLTIRDANMCTAIYPFNIGVNRIVTANATPTDPACFETLTGSIAIAAVGGQQPYTYSLNGIAGPFLPALTGLGAGVYNVLVSDADGCRVPVNNVPLVDPPLLTVSAVVTQDASCAANQGNLQATANGGTLNYSFEWDGNPALNSATYNNALPGLHTVVVTDAQGCTATASATIANIPPIFLNLAGTTPEYCDRDDGTATVQVQGGQGPFTYTWSHNAGLNSPTATGLSSGSYTATVTDINGCTAVRSATVTFTTAVTVEITEVKNSLCEQGNGRIIVAASAAPGPFTYLWSHNAALNSPVADSLHSGTYFVTVTDGNDCSTTVSAEVLFFPSPTATWTVSPAACQGNTGSIQVAIQGGTPPFNYTWSHNAGLNSNIASDLVTGTYGFTVTDFYDCTFSFSAFVWELPPPSANVTPTTATCSLPNGSAMASAFAGTAPYSYTWSNGAPNAPIAQNLAAGNYTLTVTDFFGCQGVQNFTIGNIAGPSALDIDFQHSICQGSNGFINISPVGGTAPFQYAWSHNVFLTGSSATGLAAGNYSFTVTDATGCITTGQQTILSQPSPVIQTLQQVNSLCVNGAGLIEIAATGTGPFTYTWTNGVSNGPLAQNLNAGNYTVTVTDSNGCNSTRNFTISLQPAPGIQLLQQTNDICGQGLGLLRVRNLGGALPVSYAWSHNANLNADLAAGLTAGSYTVTITDANGCQVSATYTITETPGPQVQVLNTATAFCGNPVGSVSVQATGGTGVYTYTWSHAAGLNSNFAQNLLPGAYSVTVTDANNCTASVQAVVDGTTPPVIVLQSIQDNPCLFQDASMTVSVTGVAPPFNYAWSHNAGLNSATATGLGTGTYSVTATDANGCSVALSALVTDNRGPELAVVNVNSSTCGFADGSASVSATLGQTPYTFSWNHNPALNNTVATGLAAGSYSVTVTDVNGCTATVNLTVSDSQGPQAVMQPATPAICTPDNGSISVTASGGLAPYNYAWSHNPALNAANATGLSPGAYSVTVTDANNCVAVASGMVGFVAPPTTTATATDALCVQNTGAVSVSVAGGTGPFSIVWNAPGMSGFSPAPVFPGNYSATVTDANGCTAAVNVTVNFIPGPDVVLVEQQNASCGQADGFLDVGAIGGQAPYFYQWSHNPNLNTFLANGLSAGVYTVTVTDANNCTATLTATLTDQAGPDLVLETVNSACAQNSGSAAVTATGGALPYSYTWSHNAALNSPNATDLAPGAYSVTLTDANGCSSTASGEVMDDGGVSATVASFTNAVCTDGSGSISLSIAGGQGPYAFAWSHDVALNIPNATGLSAGNYSVTVSDSNGCLDVVSQVIQFTGGPVLALQSLVDAQCQDGTGSLNFSANGGTAPFTYQWSHDPGLNAASATGLSAGTYNLTVSDANGCSATQQAQVQFVAGPQATLEAQTDAYCDNADGSVSISVSAGMAPFFYQWSHNAALNAPVATGLEAGNYSVTVTDVNGCTAQVSAEVQDIPGFVMGDPIVQDAACGSDDGQITLAPIGGQAPFQYQWSHDAGLNGPVANNLPTGIYTIEIADAAGCTQTLTVAVQNTDGPQATVESAQNPSCGNDNGSISIAVSSGQAPYEFLWSNGFTGQSASDLAAGIYTISVTDADGCQGVVSVTLAPGEAPALQSESVVNSDCITPTGSIQLAASGGAQPYSYTWSHDAGLDSPTATGLAAGTYSATLTDVNGCTATVESEVEQNSDLSLALADTQNAQCASPNGSATVAANGGQAPFNYAWQHDTGLNDATASGLVPGTYSVTATDAAGCAAELELIVGSENVPLDLAIQDNTPAACNVPNGSVTIGANSGTAPFTFVWSHDAGLTAATADGLAPGSYAATATDVNGCTGAISMQIEQTAPPTLAVQETTDADCGLATGSIELTASGGATPYIYVWSHNAGLSGNLAADLVAGSYAATVTDANGCSATTVASISDTGAPNISIETSSTYCGQAAGSATVPEAGNYTYSWVNAAQPGIIISTDATAGGLIAGNYSVTVTDENGCIAIQSAVIDELPDMVVSASASAASCFGIADGMANATVSSGGTEPFNFQWSNGNAGESIDGLSAGTYTVTVTDANGCEAVLSANVAQPAAFELNPVAVVAPLCGASDNGSIAVVASGGTGPFNYLWASGQTSASISGLGAGTYTLTVTDANGCEAIFETQLDASGDLDFSIEVVSPNCFGQNTGQATAVVSGAGPFVYQWNTPGNPGGSSVGSLAPGDYSLTVSDAGGCVSVQTFNIAQPQAIDLQADATPSCLNELNGTATATASGGTGGFTYLWSNNQQGPIIGGLLPGLISVTATDANGCTAVETLFIEGVPFPQIEIVEIEQPDCGGQSTGAATVVAIGGTGLVLFNWNDPLAQTGAQATGLQPGSYSVLATDENGCASTETVVIDPPAGLNANITELIRPSCFGNADGSATVSVVSGSGNFTYLWDDPAAQTTATAIGLAAGNYAVTVTDIDNACSTVLTVPVADPPLLALQLVTANATLCNGQSNGSATVSAAGGTGTLSYLWNDPAAQTTATAIGLAAGAYEVVVTDANGCTDAINVQIDEAPLLNAQIDDFAAPLCFGQNTGTATVSASGGTGIYTYQWNDPTLQTTATAGNLPSGSYAVTVRDANNCSTTANVTIPGAPQIIINTLDENDPACAGESNGSIGISATGGTGALSYLWSSGQTDPDVAGLGAGSYTVSVTDQNNCVEIRTFILDDPDAITLAGSTLEEATCFSSEDGSISVIIQGGAGNFTYLWDDPAGQTDATATGLLPGAYTVTATDGNGCTFSTGFNLGSEGAQIFLNAAVTGTSCQGASNAAITVSASGGAGGFSFVWAGGQTGNALSGLGAGQYSVTATDAQGCTETTEVTVLNGEPFTVDLGASDTILCEGEVLFVDFTNTDYAVQWTSLAGFSSQDPLTAIELSGSYYLQLTNAQGCVARDTINVTVLAEPLQALFIIATDVVVGEEVAAVEVSWPVPQQVEWFFPTDSVELVRQEGDVFFFRFLHPGTVRLGMKGGIGDCEDWVYKIITVHSDSTTIPGLNPDQPDILSFTIAPNPNSGVFSVQVELSVQRDIVLSIYDANGSIQDRRIGRGQSSYDENYSLALLPGTYFIILQTPKQRRTFAFLVVTP